jgi:transposase
MPFICEIGIFSNFLADFKRSPSTKESKRLINPLSLTFEKSVPNGVFSYCITQFPLKIGFTSVVFEYNSFMQNILLTPEQISILKGMHRTTKDGKKRDRIKAILFLHRGFTMKETAELLLLDEGTVRIIRDRFITDGIDEFLKDSYVLYIGKLTEDQKEKVRTFVRENLVLDSIVVIEFIKTQFNSIYTRSGIAKFLHSLGFTYKKTKLVPSQASLLKQTLHVFKYKILELLKSENEITYFIDGVHPLHNAISSYGWIERGTEKETIYIFRDNARYYANVEVRKYLETSRIVEIPLPPYSPNLNPMERLWLFMKKNLLYSHYYEHFSDFKEVIRKFFGEDFHLYREKLKTFITDDFRVLGF